MTIQIKSTGEITSAIYATTPSGNKRLNVNGKFYTDKQFSKLFDTVNEDETLVWKSHIRNMFDEILGCNQNMLCFDKPLRITMLILGKAAQDAAKIGNEIMIGHFCKLALYTFSDPTHKEYNQTLTNYYINKTK